MEAELQKFYDLIDTIEIAMMTTRRPDGHLEARAMANQKRADRRRNDVTDCSESRIATPGAGVAAQIR